MQTASNLLSAISIGTPGNPPPGSNSGGVSVSATDGLGPLGEGEPSSPATFRFSDLLAEALVPAQTDGPAVPFPALATASPAIAANLTNKLSASIAAGTPISALVQAPAPAVTGDQDEAAASDALISPGPELDEPEEPRLAKTDTAKQPVLPEDVVQTQIALPVMSMVAMVAAAPPASQSPTADPAVASPAAPAPNAPLPPLSPDLSPRADAANIAALADDTAPPVAAASAPATSLAAQISADKLTKAVAPPVANPAQNAQTQNLTPEPSIGSELSTQPATSAQPILTLAAQVAPPDGPVELAPEPFNLAQPSAAAPSNASSPLPKSTVEAQPLPQTLGDLMAKLNIDPAMPLAVAATTKPVIEPPISTQPATNMPLREALAANPSHTELDIPPAPPAIAEDGIIALTNPVEAVAGTKPAQAQALASETPLAAPVTAAKAPETVPKPNLAPVAENLAVQPPMATGLEAADSDQASAVNAPVSPEPVRQAQAVRPAPGPVRTADNADLPATQPAAPTNLAGEQGQASLEQDAQGQGGQAGEAPRLSAKTETAATDLETEARDAPVIQPLAATSQAQAASSDRQATATAQTVPMLANEILRKSGGRSAQFDISLTPEGLGKVDVQISINPKGELTASMVFDTPQAAAELRGRAAELQKSLEQAGFQVSQNGLNFSDTSRQGFGSAQQQAQHNQRQGPDHTRAFTEASDTAALTDLAVAKAYTPSNSRSIDVRI